MKIEGGVKLGPAFFICLMATILNNWSRVYAQRRQDIGAALNNPSKQWFSK
jgi:hypothetical protein